MYLQQISPDTGLYDWAVQLLKIAFPAEERRDDAEQLKVMSHPDYRLCAIFDKIPVGVVGYWETPQFVYLENFCISPEKRNGGYGSKTLQLLSSSDKLLVLEIELPVDELTIRRKNFYLRNGMVSNAFLHIQPHYRKQDADLPLEVLSFRSPLSQEEYNVFRKYLDDNVDVITRKC